MRKRESALRAALVVAGALGVSGGCAPEAPPRTHVVEIRGFEYAPAELTIARGDTVVWINRDVVPHTATDSAAAWDSDRIMVDERWTMVAGEPGRFDYICAYHPTMRARLIVE